MDAGDKYGTTPLIWACRSDFSLSIQDLYSISLHNNISLHNKVLKFFQHIIISADDVIVHNIGEGTLML